MWFPNAIREDLRKKPARLGFDHWGAADCGLQLGENLTSLYAARPPRRAARIGALINFMALDVQPFANLSSVAKRFQL